LLKLWLLEDEPTIGREVFMGKIAVALATAALTRGSLATMTAAQSQQPGALSLRTQAQNVSPVRLAGCRAWSAGCPPGTRRVCGPYHCCCGLC
jgi:hypothetical protein